MPATPIDFSQYEAKPTIDFSKYEAQPQPSAASRFGENLLSGLGISSNEQAKQFFTHPIKTFMDSIEAQGDLAKKAKDAYDKGDYMGAVQHGLNYLLPFIGQQTDQAGNQLKTGDIAGGLGRTLGAAIPIAAASPEVRAGVTSATEAAAEKGAAGVRAGARGANKALQDFPGSVGATVGATAGHATGIPGATEIGGAAGYAIGNEVLPKIRIRGEGFGLPNRVTGGPINIADWREPQPPELAAEPAANPAPTASAPAPELSPGAGESIPRTLAGDAALRKILAGQDNTNLLKIARSRGIDVTKEAQLKPGVADSQLINKIIGDFSGDELQEIRDKFLETSRFQHKFSPEAGPEFWKTMNLRTYFPDLKIPAAVEKRVAAAAAKPALAPPPGYTPTGTVPDDLTDLLQQSLAVVKKSKTR